MPKFIVKDLPNRDQKYLNRGLCPWCIEKTYDLSLAGQDGVDVCSDCGDQFLSGKAVTAANIDHAMMCGL